MMGLGATTGWIAVALRIPELALGKHQIAETSVEGAVLITTSLKYRHLSNPRRTVFQTIKSAVVNPFCESYETTYIV